MVLFLVWASPTMFHSWTADGDLQVPLVLLTATEAIAIGFLGLAVLRLLPTLRYISESYRDDEHPWPVRAIRWILSL